MVTGLDLGLDEEGRAMLRESRCLAAAVFGLDHSGSLPSSVNQSAISVAPMRVARYSSDSRRVKKRPEEYE